MDDENLFFYNLSSEASHGSDVPASISLIFCTIDILPWNHVSHTPPHCCMPHTGQVMGTAQKCSATFRTRMRVGHNSTFGARAPHCPAVAHTVQEAIMSGTPKCATCDKVRAGSEYRGILSETTMQNVVSSSSTWRRMTLATIVMTALDKHNTTQHQSGRSIF